MKNPRLEAWVGIVAKAFSLVIWSAVFVFCMAVIVVGIEWLVLARMN